MKHDTSKWEMVVHARSGRVEGSELILEDMGQHVSLISVAKPRKVSTVPIADVVKDWDRLFEKNEPNATLIFYTNGHKQKEQVIVLKKPKFDGKRLVFTFEPLSAPYQGSFEDAILYVDPFGISLADWCKKYPVGCGG